MGANAQIAVPSFTAGQVLTAAQQTQINTGIPVFATTVTRDAAFGGTGEKVLAQGQYAYIEATSTLQVYTGSAWVTAGGGLTYITQATPSAVATVSVNNCFTSLYSNYLITFNVTAGVGAEGSFTFRLRASGTDATTNYNSSRIAGAGGAVSSTANPDGTDEWSLGAFNPAASTTYSNTMNVFAPQLTQATNYNAIAGLNIGGGNFAQYILGGTNTNATAYDGFTVTIAGTSFTGTIRVYGYQNS
jgi:hypothetical protein